MGKQPGFMEIAGGALPPSRRRTRQRLVRDLQPFPEEKVRTQGARCMDCGVPFCHTGCPLNNIIPDWNDLVYRDRWQEAIRRCTPPTTSRSSPGRVCPAPANRPACSASTNRRSPSSHRKTIIDHAWRRRLDPRRTPSTAPAKRRRHRLGPRRLAAAQQLNRAGHTSRSSRRPTASAACSATASPTSRWRSTTSTGASIRCAPKASSSA
jgi:glutamate synthase (NADPH) small chain